MGDEGFYLPGTEFKGKRVRLVIYTHVGDLPEQFLMLGIKNNCIVMLSGLIALTATFSATQSPIWSLMTRWGRVESNSCQAPTTAPSFALIITGWSYIFSTSSASTKLFCISNQPALKTTNWTMMSSRLVPFFIS